MDHDLLRAKQPDFQHKKKINNLMPLSLVLGLHTLPANPKLSVALFLTSIIILHETTGTSQRTNSP